MLKTLERCCTYVPVQVATSPQDEMSQDLSRLEFGSNDIDNAMSRLSPFEINRLAFGTIQLDAAGTILQFNEMEGKITGRDPKQMVGKNFFTEVAPCTNTPTFKGAFDRGVKAGDLNVMFEYTFDYVMTPTRVKVHMKKAVAGGSYWVFIKRI